MLHFAFANNKIVHFNAGDGYQCFGTARAKITLFARRDEKPAKLCLMVLGGEGEMRLKACTEFAYSEQAPARSFLY